MESYVGIDAHCNAGLELADLPPNSRASLRVRI